MFLSLHVANDENVDLDLTLEKELIFGSLLTTFFRDLSHQRKLIGLAKISCQIKLACQILTLTVYFYY
jgi:hypothetical protein